MALFDRPTTNVYGQNLKLDNGQFISTQDPNYDTYAAQLGLSGQAKGNAGDISKGGDIANIAQGAQGGLGNALMGLMKQYQGIEKYPFAEQGFKAQEAQNARITTTPENMIGASPGQQSSVRRFQGWSIDPWR